jgi:hypothetical protein
MPTSEEGARRLAAWLYRGQPPQTDETEFLVECWDIADALVTAWLSENLANQIPDEVRTRAVLLTAAETYHRRGTKSGILNPSTEVGEVVRLAQDPMAPAKQLLKPWVIPL